VFVAPGSRRPAEIPRRTISAYCERAAKKRRLILAAHGRLGSAGGLDILMMEAGRTIAAAPCDIVPFGRSLAGRSPVPRQCPHCLRLGITRHLNRLASAPGGSSGTQMPSRALVDPSLVARMLVRTSFALRRVIFRPCPGVSSLRSPPVLRIAQGPAGESCIAAGPWRFGNCCPMRLWAPAWARVVCPNCGHWQERRE
jgi:hypothetical protein